MQMWILRKSKIICIQWHRIKIPILWGRKNRDIARKEAKEAQIHQEQHQILQLRIPHLALFMALCTTANLTHQILPAAAQQLLFLASSASSSSFPKSSLLTSWHHHCNLGFTLIALWMVSHGLLSEMCSLTDHMAYLQKFIHSWIGLSSFVEPCIGASMPS